MELAGLFTVAAGAVRLHGSRCPACGTVAFPGRAVCGACACRDLEPAELSGRGTVHAFTTVRTPPAGFDRPYLAAVVDLDEGPRVFAMLTAEPSGEARVRAVPAPVRDGQPGFAFEPQSMWGEPAPPTTPQGQHRPAVPHGTPAPPTTPQGQHRPVAGRPTEPGGSAAASSVVPP